MWRYFDRRFTIGQVVTSLVGEFSGVNWDDTLVDLELDVKLEDLTARYGLEEGDLVNISI